MPWKIAEVDGMYCVHKMNDDDTMGEKVECHATMEEAEAHMRALYANMEDMGGDMSGKAAVKALTGGGGNAGGLGVGGVPYGSPSDRDGDGQYFDARTVLHEDKFPLPPAVYYHGIADDGKRLAPTPEYIGKTVSFEDRADGRWYRVVLNQAADKARRIWDAAKQGKAFVSSGSNHLHRVDRNGRIVQWPVLELSLIDAYDGRAPANKHAIALPALKAIYAAAGIDLPAEIGYTDSDTDTQGTQGVTPFRASDVIRMDNSSDKERDMEPQEIQDLVVKSVDDALKAQWDADEAARKDREARESDKQAAIKAALDLQAAEFAKSKRLPEGIPYVAKYGDVWKYDNLEPGDMALMIGLLREAKASRLSKFGESEAAVKALGIKLEEDAAKDGEIGIQGMYALKAAGFAGKANDLNYSTYATYGDEFVGVAYSQALWESIRKGAVIANRLPTVEVPPGHESINVPVEGEDPIFYKVVQATGLASATDSHPAATVTASKAATTNVSLTLNKMGARTIYSGELEEDSIVPWVNYLRTKMVTAGNEYLDASIIDGDNATGATTNVNDIAGTPAGTEYFILYDGFRVSPLVTTTANSRAGGTLDVNDFLATLQLMGVQGKNADQSNTVFIMPPSVQWKALQLAEVKTRDVFSQPTLENGRLVQIFGYGIITSYFYNFWSVKSGLVAGYEYKENSAGKLDVDTASNNTFGSFLAVRFDQWLLGYRRRMLLEMTRFPESDSTQIVAQMRVGLIQRDTEAAAITYGITV